MDKILNKIPLSKGYHNFADKRTYLGIPNFLNVIIECINNSYNIISNCKYILSSKSIG